ncbi:MAG: RNA polymerase sigma-70 factor [Bacteroidales bacterium]|nr:MAG: RNA polymerase sigma-70 factor [Bacteroidales bacterium]
MQLAGFIKQSRIKQDDLVEFEKLFKSYYSPLCHFAFKLLKDMDIAEEVVQEFFYNYWKNRHTMSIQISIKSYMYRAIRNNSLKYLEHVKVVKKYERNFIDTNSSESGFETNELEVKELNDIIENTLSQLPERCSQIFKLSRFEGLKYNEIAEKLSISVKTVEANMGRALQLFRKNLKQYEEIAC